jgi:hypothetical protein
VPSEIWEYGGDDLLDVLQVLIIKILVAERILNDLWKA